MSVLKFWDGTNEFRFTRVTKLDISFFSIKNQYTSETGSTVIYPVKSHKARIAFTAEIQGDYGDVKSLSLLMKIISKPEFGCDLRYPEHDWIPNSDGKKPDNEIINLKVYVTSDISVTKIMSETGIDGGLYAVSATIEEV